MQKGRIDYVPPQPDVLKGALSQGCAACANAHSLQLAMHRNHRWVMAPLSSERQHHVNIKAAGRHSFYAKCHASVPVLPSNVRDCQSFASAQPAADVPAASVPIPGAFKAVNGQAAQPGDARVADAFPQLTRVPHVALEATGGPLAAAPGADRSLNVGVVLSGGQAPGARRCCRR